MIANGFSNQHISEHFALSLGTIKNHVYNIFKKSIYNSILTTYSSKFKNRLSNYINILNKYSIEILYAKKVDRTTTLMLIFLKY